MHELSADEAAAPLSIDLAAPGRGGVRYGEAVAFGSDPGARAGPWDALSIQARVGAQEGRYRAVI